MRSVTAASSKVTRFKSSRVRLRFRRKDLLSDFAFASSEYNRKRTLFKSKRERSRFAYGFSIHIHSSTDFKGMNGTWTSEQFTLWLQVNII